MTTTTSEVTDQMIDVALDRIIPNPWQPRTVHDQASMHDLQQNILAVGLLQEPMARRKENLFQLAFGHRRIDAIRGLHENGQWGPAVRLKVAELSDEDMAYIALSENRARKDLTPAEEITAWAKVLREIPGVTIQSLADKVGIDRSTMSKNLAVLNLPDSVLGLVNAGEMSLRSAREFLVLRNDDHCHEDQIALVLEDLSGSYSYSNSYISEHYDNSAKPPDYRLKTVRASIHSLALGRPAYGHVQGIYENDRKWRPLCKPEESGTGRAASFDVEAFKSEFPNSVHVLPVGEESGGAEWTCEVKAWASWSSRATREANKAATSPDTEDGKEPLDSGAQNGRVNHAAEWWKAVKRDPVVQEVVGKRLRATKGPQDLTEEDRAALGSRVEPINWNNVIQLPTAAQPEGVKVNDYSRASNPPLFDFGLCATCVLGAAWGIPHGSANPVLVCNNQQAWLDKASVGMQTWVDAKDEQMERDRSEDAEATGRLARADAGDAKALIYSLWGVVQQPEVVKPLSRSQVPTFEERTRHNYWPAGAESFAALTGLNLPEPAISETWQIRDKWATAADAWLKSAPDNFDWPLALACVLVWQARVAQGLGVSIWNGVAVATATTAD